MKADQPQHLQSTTPAGKSRRILIVVQMVLVLSGCEHLLD